MLPPSLGSVTSVATQAELLEVDGREVKVGNPDKIFFPADTIMKLELVKYFIAVGSGALNGALNRPTTLHRFPDGVAGEDFYQKRIPKHRPDWIESTTIRFPSGRSAEMLRVVDVAHIAWAINLGCLEINPWPVRAADVDHPDELRIDLDPTPEIPFADVRDVTLVLKEVLDEHGLTGWPKTSGKRGMHVLVRVVPEWEFTEVRRAALAIAREVERRAPGVATTAWWKEERVGVFLDFNQNARDRTVASAYSVRPMEDARVSFPITWDLVADVEPETFTVRTVPDLFATNGDAHAGIDDSMAPLDSVLEMALEDERGGLGDAPWPPHFPKMKNEPKRVQPSKAKKED
ncbi:MAG: ATP-dependent DNA ligase [Actinobacteria bacterium]|nr:ATP-dependent DNA ligase [Actinomycetota bacterium]